MPLIYSLVAEATQRGKILFRTKSDLRKNLRYFRVAVLPPTSSPLLKREEHQRRRVVACCSLEIYSKKLAEIRSLVVEKNYEGQGIASALLEHCLTEAKKKKIYEVLVITDRENLFKRKGFAEQLHGQKALFLRPK